MVRPWTTWNYVNSWSLWRTKRGKNLVLEGYVPRTPPPHRINKHGRRIWHEFFGSIVRENISIVSLLSWLNQSKTFIRYFCSVIVSFSCVSSETSKEMNWPLDTKEIESRFNFGYFLWNRNRVIWAKTLRLGLGRYLNCQKSKNRKVYWRERSCSRLPLTRGCEIAHVWRQWTDWQGNLSFGELSSRETTIGGIDYWGLHRTPFDERLRF